MRVHSDEQPRSATLTLRDKGFHWEAAIFFVGFLLAFGGKNHDEKNSRPPMETLGGRVSIARWNVFFWALRAPYYHFLFLYVYTAARYNV